jgi:hypothetical protein
MNDIQYDITILIQHRHIFVSFPISICRGLISVKVETDASHMTFKNIE